jgi:predicted dehydrogenase
VISAVFENEVTATFAMHGFATSPARTLRLSGTEGDVRGSFEKRRLHISWHRSGRTESVQAGEPLYGHEDGDEGLCRSFINLVRREAKEEVLASGRSALESHLMGFAAEEARLGGDTIDMRAYRNRLAA